MSVIRRSLVYRAAAAGCAALGVAALAAGPFARSWVAEAAASPPADDPWTIEVPRPIAVSDGHAQFVAPSRSTSDRTLVVVSAITRTSGAYPIRILASPATRADAPALADDGPTKSPTPSLTPQTVEHHTPKSDPPAYRMFHLPVRDGDPASPSNYAPVRAKLRVFSPTVQVYVDPKDLDRVDDATLQDAMTTFDERVRPFAKERIGLANDTDHDGRFAILFSSWLGHLADGKLTVDGYVRGADLEPLQSPPIGNRADVMYLNAAMRSGPHLRTVIAHEYTHAVTYGRKALGPAKADEEGWLDEGLAHLSEDLHGFSRSNLDYRVSTFLNAPERYRVLVEDFGAADTIRSHGHRGASYLFVRWCADHFGPDLFGRLVRSERRGVPNLERETGQSFARLYRGWSVDVFLAAMARGSSPEAVPPRSSRVIPGGPADEAVLDATTTHYAVIEGCNAGAVDVRVEGPPGAMLQVTVVPLPRDYPRIDLNAGIEGSIDSARELVARIRDRDGSPVTISSISWCAADGHSGGSIQGDALRKTLGSDRIAEGDYLASHPIPIDDGAWTVIVVGVDSSGRKVVARDNVGRGMDRAATAEKASIRR